MLHSQQNAFYNNVMILNVTIYISSNYLLAYYPYCGCFVGFIGLIFFTKDNAVDLLGLQRFFCKLEH